MLFALTERCLVSIYLQITIKEPSSKVPQFPNS